MRGPSRPRRMDGMAQRTPESRTISVPSKSKKAMLMPGSGNLPPKVSVPEKRRDDQQREDEEQNGSTGAELHDHPHRQRALVIGRERRLWDLSVVHAVVLRREGRDEQ